MSAAPATSTRPPGIVPMFIGLMTAMLLSALDQTMFATALPTIVGELGGVDLMLWVTTAYILAATITMPIYGKFGDLVGRKSLLLVAIAIFIAGSVVGALATDMPGLIFGRAVQGIGGGGLMVLAQAIIADVIPARERGRYMGFLGSVFALSSVLGPLLGGWFTESIGWQWCLWINIPMGAIAVVTVLFFLHPPAVERAKVVPDVAGMTLLAIATTCLVLATTWGGHEYAWISPMIIMLLIVTVGAGVGLVAVERRAKEPVLPLGLFRRRNFVLTTLAGLMVGIAMFGTVTYMPTYMQMVTGVNATVAGLLIVPLAATQVATSIIAGRRVSRTGRYKAILITGVGIVTVALLLMSTMVYDEPLWITCLYLAILGLGLGMVMQNLVLVVQNTFPLSVVGTATAANNYFRQIGATLGAALVGSLFTGRLTSLLTNRLPADAVEASGADFNSITPEAVAALPDPYHDIVVSSYNDALAPVLGWIAPLTLVAVVMLLFVKEVPLRTSVNRDETTGERAPVTESVGESLDWDGRLEADYSSALSPEVRAEILADERAELQERLGQIDAEVSTLELQVREARAAKPPPGD
ncbi:MDR family MFS transporter [Demequina sp. NBRC 110057]|uniref:MDR family MFS transporter n=1 Tax=Demequina sp. NBRC 110057 TaxID=1570346 RepID=UPI0009FC35EB|nr:MDR family MFS transporter [Demequina sp. NBRC 110057]